MKPSGKKSAGPSKAGKVTDPEAPVAAEQGDRGGGRLFPIIGIGASAGGVEALEVFFRNTPADSGSAFVIVQHLDPTHEDMMPELLQRRTAMRVRRIDAVRIIPYRTRESRIDGLVLTFLDVSDARKVTDELHECRLRMQALGAGGEKREGGHP
jgi:hypothetical protein